MHPLTISGCIFACLVDVTAEADANQRLICIRFSCKFNGIHGVCGWAKFLAPPYYSLQPARSVCVSSHWCGLRPSVLGQDRPETKKISLGLGLGPAGLVLCCETRSCHARRHNDLEGHSDFSSTIYSLSWNITTLEINSGVHFLKS